MSLDWILLGLRIISTIILYMFLGGAFYILWRDLKQSAAQTLYQGNTSHRLRLITTTGMSATNDLPLAEEIFSLQPVTILGRDINNTIVIHDAAVSARHARLSRENGIWWLEDLGSKNGTLLNELPLSKPTSIEPGDIIGLGDLRLVLETGVE